MFLKLALNAILLSGLAGVILAKEDNSMASWIRGNANKSPTPEAIAAVRKLSENLAFLEEIMGDGIGEDNFDETGEIAKLPSDQTKFNYHWGLLLAGLGNVLHHIEDGFCAIGNCLHELGPLDTGGVNEAGSELNHTHDFDLPPHNHDFTVDKHKHNFALPNHTHPIPTLDCKCMSNCTQVCTCENTATGKPAMVDRGMTMDNEDFSGTTNDSVGGSGTTGSSGPLDHTHNLDELQADLNDCGEHVMDKFNSMECMHNMTNHTGLHNHTAPTPAPTMDDMGGGAPTPSGCPDDPLICDGRFVACECCPPDNIKYYYFKLDTPNSTEYKLPGNLNAPGVCPVIPAAVDALEDGDGACDGNYTVNDSTPEMIANWTVTQDGDDFETVTVMLNDTTYDSWIVNNAHSHKEANNCFPGVHTNCTNEIVFNTVDQSISHVEMIFARCEL